MLVHCVYFRDLNPLEELGTWIGNYNNAQAKNYGDQHWKPYPVGGNGSIGQLKDLGLAFLRRKSSHCNSNAPSLAIILRSTIPTNPLDILADVRIGVERLNHSNRVLQTVT
jgi:hypothetical protein